MKILWCSKVIIVCFLLWVVARALLCECKCILSCCFAYCSAVTKVLFSGF